MNKSTPTPKTNQSGINNKKCSYAKCRTLMLSPITCKSCQHSYCPTHRLAQDHSCNLSSSTLNSVPSSTKPTMSQGNMLGYPNLMKNLLVNKTIAQKSSSSPIIPSQSTEQHINPGSNFSLKETMTKIKANQRNKSELESKQKALEFRIKNGLLTEVDKLELQKLQEKRPNHELFNPNHTTTTHATKAVIQSNCCIV